MHRSTGSTYTGEMLGTELKKQEGAFGECKEERKEKRSVLSGTRQPGWRLSPREDRRRRRFLAGDYQKRKGRGTPRWRIGKKGKEGERMREEFSSSWMKKKLISGGRQIDLFIPSILEEAAPPASGEGRWAGRTNSSKKEKKNHSFSSQG